MSTFTNYHKFRWLKTTEINPFTVLEAKIQNEGIDRTVVPLKSTEKGLASLLLI
jgi:hypothetical protein